MTQFTSFVAVEEMIVTDGGQPRRIDVPVEVPEGVNRATAYGEERPTGFLTRSGTQNFMFSAGVVNSSVAEVVSVSGSTGVNTSSSNVTTTIDGNLLDPAAASAARTSKPKSARVKSGPGGGLGTGSGSGGGGGDNNSAGVTSPEELKRRDLVTKLHPSLLAVVDRLKKNDMTVGADETKFNLNGKAEIQIWLADKSQETLAKLKALGFELVLDPKSAKLVIGRLPIEKLEALAEMKAVRYVTPGGLKK
jgi:hypothetical protein